MSRIRGKNTRPEIAVRSTLHRLGYRFRLHVASLPGKPDIVMRKYMSVIFVHGCFWHRHGGCKRCTTPRTNIDYWLPKLEGNAKRDKLHKIALAKLGWRVLVIWECELRNSANVELKLLRFLKSNTQ